MGESLQTRVARAFKRYSNGAFQQRLNTPDLFFEYAFVNRHLYKCRVARPSTSVSPHEMIMICRAGARLRVWREGEEIGEIVGPDADELTDAFNGESRACNMVVGLVQEGVGLDGFFSLMLMSGGDSLESRDSN